jgi:hypothetical protein
MSLDMIQKAMGLGAQINTTPDLARVVMPLVKLLRDARISWSDRETIAGAIDTAIRQHKDMEAEQQQLGLQKAYAGQAMQQVGQGKL